MGFVLANFFCEFTGVFKLPLVPFNPAESADVSLNLVQSCIESSVTSALVSYNLNKKMLNQSHTRLDFINYGSIMSSALQEEIAFQCYYIAYLMDIDKMDTNSDLPFTIVNDKSIDEIE